MEVIKRDGTTEVFNNRKIAKAIGKAMRETDVIETDLVTSIAFAIQQELKGNEQVSIELIQDMVEEKLMRTRPDVAKKYILYRDKRAKERENGWQMTELQKSIWENKYRFKNETFAQWIDRVSGGNEQIKKRMRKKQFLFGGRILANRGLQKHGLKITYSNCYVLTPPQDNIESIFDTARNMARTYSYGGGVGISIRNIRPRGARVHNNARSTTGAVSFMPLYSLTTETIGQHGRRGALMISIPSSSPDLEEFIDVKTEQGAITGANISIEIDDAFMMAVKKREQYRLHFHVEDTGETIEKMVDAHAIYEKIIKNNLDWAEPGMLYWDAISNYHFMSEDPTFEFGGTNPCAEEPLPPGGSCLLGSINLDQFVIAPFSDYATFDMEEFLKCIEDAVIALNEVLDEGLPLHPLEEQRQSVRELRQIGLGVMGIANMLIKLRMTYGEQDATNWQEVLAFNMINQAVQTSAKLAKEHGTFEKYNYEYISKSPFFQQTLTQETKNMVKKYGLRNSQILCIAPTGSISTMLGVSGGIEPIFSFSYERTTKSLHGQDVTYKVYEQILQEYMDYHGLDNADDLPEYFVTAHTVHWKDRIDTQSIWQKFIDASISSTINLPENATLEDTKDLYMYAWEKGLKGCTIYRENCKRTGILVSDEGKKKKKVEGYFSTCPECQSDKMEHANGCITCKECGFSPC